MVPGKFPPKTKEFGDSNRPVGYHLSPLMAAIRTGWEFIVGKCGHDLVNLYLAICALKHGGNPVEHIVEVI